MTNFTASSYEIKLILTDNRHVEGETVNARLYKFLKNSSFLHWKSHTTWAESSLCHTERVNTQKVTDEWNLLFDCPS